MSYYNYAYKAIKSKDITEDVRGKDEYLIFDRYCDGFEDLLFYLGDEYLHENLLILKPAGGLPDTIRPSDMDHKSISNRENTFIGDADCCTPVEFLEESIKWLEVDAIHADDYVKKLEDMQDGCEDLILLYSL